MKKLMHYYIEDPFNEPPSPYQIVQIACRLRNPPRASLYRNELLTLISPKFDDALQRMLACMMISYIAKRQQLTSTHHHINVWENLKLELTYEIDKEEHKDLKKMMLDSITDSLSDKAIEKIKQPYRDLCAAMALVDAAFLRITLNMRSSDECLISASPFYEDILRCEVGTANNKFTDKQVIVVEANLLWQLAAMDYRMTKLSDTCLQLFMGDKQSDIMQDRIQRDIRSVEKQLIRFYSIFQDFAPEQIEVLSRENEDTLYVPGLVFSRLAQEKKETLTLSLLSIMDNHVGNTASSYFVKMIIWSLIGQQVKRLLNKAKDNLYAGWERKNYQLAGDNSEVAINAYLDVTFRLSPIFQSLLDIPTYIENFNLYRNNDIKRDFLVWLEHNMPISSKG